MFALDVNYSEDCFKADTQTAVIINANKFTNVWLQLHNNNNEISNSQHLQKYLENVLENRKGTLDVEQFAMLWDKAGNRLGEDHLTTKIATMVETTKSEKECYHATDTRDTK